MSKTVCTNPTAHKDYHIEEKFETGIELKGSEVKSLRAGQASLKESFGTIKEGEVYLINSYIAPYEQANIFNHETKRDRKLLMHRREINRLIGKTKTKGYTLVPLKIFFSNRYAKLELGLGKGKKNIDKREDIKRKDAEREMERAIKKKYN
ncbi:MAG: SsrA-binding protein SmpB [Candidatus Dadabacteria bacterium]|nr:SsrA-binding protein SmpB [Candidatus Dadabacteria bacterium]NIS07649.1 SsrA-binding protein SmpB [Candidatus Dadabacteria bacterium]NIV42120.1 SsrA-binding protein SmpB [Candidatus Dadabacteria bacterium]NIX14744.1 SsrA-binding protein SmpB [Candidatus Dadabacteria bacterium]NIY21287.1 SsrA-binding protein SmpB [Candidatus Dadabacteria bacterium]